MNSNIKNLLTQDQCLSRNSITFGNGKIILLDIRRRNKYYIWPIIDCNIEDYLKYNHDKFASFDVFAQTIFENFEIYVGDGSSEENGNIHVIDNRNKSLVWFAFFEDSEPFTQVHVDKNGIINALSESGIIWKIPIETPLKIDLEYP